MGDSHHFHHHHHHPRPKSQVFCDDDDDDLEFPERSSSSTGLIRHSETHHSVQQSQTQKSELEQLRSRVCQMEKTMRWWSDCTSNWKQKWSQVRQERNALRVQLKEITGGSVAPKPETRLAAVQTDPCEDRSQLMNNNAQNMSTAADVHLLTKLLDEAQRTINIEREEKLHLHRSIERLQQDLLEFHTMYDELVKEVQLLKLDDNNSKASEVDQQEVEVVEVEVSGNMIKQQSEQESVEEVETAVDGDEEDEDDNEQERQEPCDDSNAPATTATDNAAEHEEGGKNQGTDNGNAGCRIMSNSKSSQQITTSKSDIDITNDADHHTSL